MEIKHLEYLVAVAETNSMHHAAEQLHVSQQNISKVLKQLEDELNIALFVRSTKGCTLTAEGHEIYIESLEILKKINALKNKHLLSCKPSPNIEGSIKIYCSNGISDIADSYILPFQRQYPKTKVFMTECGIGEILPILEHNNSSDRFDVAFVQISMDQLMSEKSKIQANFHCYLLDSEPLKVVMHKDNPYAKQSSISLKKLSSLPFIANTALFDKMPNHIQTLLDRGINLNIVYCSNSVNSLTQYLKNNMAFSLSTKANLKAFPDNNLVCVPIKERIYVALCCFVIKNDLSLCSQLFFDFFRQNMPSSTQKLF